MRARRIFGEKIASTLGMIAIALWVMWFAIAQLGVTRFFRRSPLGPDEAATFFFCACLVTVLYGLRVMQLYFRFRK